MSRCFIVMHTALFVFPQLQNTEVVRNFDGLTGRDEFLVDNPTDVGKIINIEPDEISSDVEGFVSSVVMIAASSPDLNRATSSQ